MENFDWIIRFNSESSVTISSPTPPTESEIAKAVVLKIQSQREPGEFMIIDQIPNDPDANIKALKHHAIEITSIEKVG